MKKLLLLIVLVSLLTASCSSFGTTKDRWSDRYKAQSDIFKSIQEMKHERAQYLIKLLDSVEGESRGLLLAMIVMDAGGDYRDYADVLAAITPPARTSGEIIAQGVADVLPFAVMGATMGWMSSQWARAVDNGPAQPLENSSRSYHSGGDMSFDSWNPSTTTTTTSTSIPAVAP